MTDTGPVTYTLDGRVASIVMDDGKANVQNATMHAALNAALESEHFPERDDARAQLARLNAD